MCVPCPGSPQPEVGDSLSAVSLLFLNVLETWPVGGAEHTVSHLHALCSLILLCLECSSFALYLKSTSPSWVS